MPANIACFIVFAVVAAATFFVMRKLTRGRVELAAFLSVLCALCGYAFAQTPDVPQEVDAAEIKRLGDHVQYVDGNAIRDAGDYVEVMGPPADDNHKWFISVIGSKGCAACARLKADLKTNEYLRALIVVHENDDNHSDTKTSWSHYTYYLAGDKSQDFRWKDLKIKGYPTILVQPPLNKKYGDPSTVVIQMTGYDGDGKKLATNIAAGIKAYLAKQAEVRSTGHRAQLVSLVNAREGEFPPQPPAPRASSLNPQASGWGQIPWTPAPKVDATPVPPPSDTPPNVLPPLFDWPPKPIGPAPAPAPPATPETVIPSTPEAVIVCETNCLSRDDEDRMRPVLDRIRKERPGLKVRIADLRESKHLPVVKDDLPAVVITSDGAVQEKITARLFPLFNPPLLQPATPTPSVNAPAVNVTSPPVTVTVPTAPWEETATAFATGSIPSIIAAAVGWLIYIRGRRKAAGQQVIAPNVPFEAYAPLIEHIVTQAVTKAVEAFKPKEPAK